jgi:hypothetical protein
MLLQQQHMSMLPRANLLGLQILLCLDANTSRIT